SAALKKFGEQTGLALRDLRQAKDDPRLDLDLARVPFWRAVDTISRLAGAGVSVYQPDGSVALVNAGGRPVPVSYHGMFRTTVKHLGLNDDLEAGTHICTVRLDVAWEPRLHPFLLEVGACSVVFARDDKGHALRVDLPSRGRMTVTGHPA